jgi:hypothetical protein
MIRVREANSSTPSEIVDYAAMETMGTAKMAALAARVVRRFPTRHRSGRRCAPALAHCWSHQNARRRREAVGSPSSSFAAIVFVVVVKIIVDRAVVI